MWGLWGPGWDRRSCFRPELQSLSSAAGTGEALGRGGWGMGRVGPGGSSGGGAGTGGGGLDADCMQAGLAGTLNVGPNEPKLRPDAGFCEQQRKCGVAVQR